MGTVTVNGQTYTGNSISVKNNKVIVDGKNVTGKKFQTVDIKITGNVGTIDCSGSVKVIGDVDGNIDAGNSVICGGDVSGCIDAGNSVECGNVFGSVDAGNNIIMRKGDK